MKKSQNLVSFTATFLSVLLPIILGMTIFFLQVEAREKRKEQQLRVQLSAELSDTLRALEHKEKLEVKLTDNESVEVLVTYIQPIVLEDAARSGLFTAVDTENMLHLARKMRMYNFKCSSLLSLIASGNPEHASNVIVSSQGVETTRKAIIEAIHLVSKQMEIEFSPSLEQSD